VTRRTPRATLPIGGLLGLALVAYARQMRLRMELEREDDGRWLADVAELPGVLACGDTPDQAVANVMALALRVLADRIEAGELEAASFTFERAA
jgi:predicted RNase H-like HicB family nuclease